MQHSTHVVSIVAALCSVAAAQIRPPAPDTAQAYYERAVAAESAGNYEAAIRELRGAVKAQPGDASLHTALGVAYFHEGYPADALGEFRRPSNCSRLTPMRASISPPYG